MQQKFIDLRRCSFDPSCGLRVLDIPRARLVLDKLRLEQILGRLVVGVHEAVVCGRVEMDLFGLVDTILFSRQL